MKTQAVKVEIDETAAKIIAEARAAPGIRMSEMARAVGISYTQTRARVYDLDAKRILLTKRIRWRVYIYVRPEVAEHE